MEITTMLNALIDSHGRIPGIFMEKRTRQHYRIRSWFAKRDKRQREDIARLKARVATLERIMEREAEKTAKAGMPKEGINGKDN
jgi:hypothetical protein